MTLNPSYAPFTLIMFIYGWFLFKAHNNEGSPFNFFDLFLATETGKASLEKTGLLLGQLTVTWWFIDLAAKDKATAAEAAVYIGALIIARGASKLIDSKGDSNA